MKYWLMKTEPNTYSWDDLNEQPGKKDHWDGVRNYQARNFIKEMKKGDLAFFYHSVVRPPGIVGVVEVVKTAYADFTAFDSSSKYFDAKSSPENPRWFMVDIKARKKLKKMIPLDELKTTPGLETMQLLKKGNRLSIQPVTEKEFKTIMKIAGEKL